MTDHPLMPTSNSTPLFHSWVSHGSGSRTNLPFPLTSFVGRISQVAEITRLASTTRLLTLTGPGGVGKTRLALEVAGHLLPQFADGIWMVDLAPLSQADEVPQAMALALGVRQEAKRPVLVTLVDALRERQILVLLDNCEHVLTACLEVIAALLGACPALSVLATSREALGVVGELLWRVPSLSVPPSSFAQPAQGGSESLTEQIRSYEAVQLFLTRATAVRPDFHLTPTNVAAIAQICQRLDGIPLAIELAAARVQVLSTEQIAARLADRFGLLTSGNRLALARQQTLRATLDWSYGLLEDEEQMLLRRLAVFAGAFSLEAAEAVCSREGSGTLGMLDGLTQLVNKSLVVMEEHEEQARYRLLDTVRQYALEKLEGSGEGAQLRDRHLAFALALVLAAEPGFQGREQVRWIRRLEQAYVNLRAACDWALDSQQWDLGLRLAGGLWPFWEISGRTVEGCEWLEVILQRTEQSGRTADRGQALLACGSLASQLGEYPLAYGCLEEGLAIFRAQDDPRTLALALSAFGWYLIDTREHERAHVLLEESLTLCQRIGERHTLALVLALLGMVAFGEGQTLRAREYLEQALALLRELDDGYHEANVLIYLGKLARFEGQVEQAEPLYLEAWRRYQELGHAWRAAMALSSLAGVARARGDFPRAVALSTQALLTNVYRQGSKERIYSGLIQLGGMALQLGEPNLAARLYGSAEVLHETYGVSLDPTAQAHYERDRAAFQTIWDTASFQADRKEGRRLSPEQAVALLEPLQLAAQAAEKATTLSPSSPGTSTYPADLTAREVEVLQLVAHGLTNKQIAQQLVISPKTVNRHLESIFSKLGVTSRAAATRFAVAHHLT